MAAAPDVAMTLALFGTRLSRVGITLSAPWSNLFRRTEDRCLVDTETRLKTLLLSVHLGHCCSTVSEEQDSREPAEPTDLVQK